MLSSKTYFVHILFFLSKSFFTLTGYEIGFNVKAQNWEPWIKTDSYACVQVNKKAIMPEKVIQNEIKNLFTIEKSLVTFKTSSILLQDPIKHVFSAY